MAEEDFDIDALANYLHMMPAQINRLAERGQLPGRRVGGQWRFSRHEIHHWLEQRIGISDEEQLAAMEGVLDRSADPEAEPTIEIARLMPPEAIAVPLDAKTRGRVVERMTELAEATGLLWDAPKMADAVRAREAMHSTALESGIAMLHPRRPMPSILGEAVVALGITSRGIPFGGSAGLTDVFILICATSDNEHLRVLARLSRLITEGEFLSSLRAASDPQEAHELIQQRDEALE